MSFSERMGFTSARDSFQIEAMDEPLRNRLWNVLLIGVVRRVDAGLAYTGVADICSGGSAGEKFLYCLHDSFFRTTVSLGPVLTVAIWKALREFVDYQEWFRVYDLIEFVLERFPYPDARPAFTKALNEVLEKELAGYRILGERMSPITSDEEIRELDQALEDASSRQASRHLARALELLSDREAPDFRNSVKESISAVESECGVLTSSPKASLGQALKKLDADSALTLHPALREAMNKLYGFTCDADGIRHALMDEDTLEIEDAKFMLVACAAFVNYLRAKEARLQT